MTVPVQPRKKSKMDQFDSAMLRIDAATAKIHADVAEAKESGGGPGLTPTKGFSPPRLKRTRMDFQAMSDSSLLTDSGDDITLNMLAQEQKALDGEAAT